MAIQVTSNELEQIAPGCAFDYHGRLACVLRVDPVRFSTSPEEIGRRFRWIEIDSKGAGTIGFHIQEPAPESGAQQDYRIFLQGGDAFQRNAPRKPPASLGRVNPDFPALWLAGYDAEKSEQADMRRIA